MSEIINNRQERLALLKSMILKINSGETPEAVKQEISSLLKEVPYEDVVTVEQELFSEGVDRDNMLELCDLHSDALKGIIDLSSSRKEPSGHPVHTFKRENQALRREISFIRKIFTEINAMDDEAAAGELFLKLHTHFNNLMDVDKHYLRKENLLFPFLEKYKITGPSTVMWGKDDEARTLLKNALTVLPESHNITSGDGKAVIEISLAPAAAAVEEMIYKEEQILFPMAMDTLKEEEWFEVMRQSDEIGYCLFAPVDEWKPAAMENSNSEFNQLKGKVNLPTGSFTLKELTAMLDTFPFDVTFVDKDDFVRFFSHGKERIFQRNKAILGRKVQFCHPPSSLSVVEKILDDLRQGRQEKAEFWINMRGRFIFISYYAVRSETNEYLGTLEVTQDLTRLRQLEGERRILSYDENTETEKN
ncbi:MAG: DUF438 domain-containing protein [Ignavibacteria bacterium]|jgi:DUF438 domain-containing protein|nr:DUF438 domain-containing protein [Ignavibacteria bacterium]MCU7513303.1 DUF438 domain-containing protein [Ignavibacteria bacterium]MCU7524148.1 DUF438 domain-containing protein [Ignavibacteria bacterium]